MNIALDPETESNLRAIAQQRHVSIETFSPRRSSAKPGG